MGNRLRAVLAGYGNIGRAFESILGKKGGVELELTICEIKDGCDCLDHIASHADSIDAVVNLSTQATADVFSLCMEKGLDYIDAGLEGVPRGVSLFDCFNGFLAKRAEARMMFGFGVNPGVLEHVYFRNRPAGRHLAFEFEYDDARASSARLFNTWSPASYYDEAALVPKIVASGDSFADVTAYCDAHGPFRLTAGGRLREFLMIPHEELFSLRRLDKNCLGAGYLYQAPLPMQNFCRERGNTASPEEIAAIPTLHDIDGDDNIGFLFHDFTDNLYFVKNSTSHREIFREYGVNATCWQTACGMYSALRMLPFVEKGVPVTMSDLSLRFPGELDTIFRDLGFAFERIDRAVGRAEFEAEIMPLFPGLRA